MTHPSVVGLESGSLDLDDLTFIAAMESAAFPNDRFRHFDHLRLAWLLLRDAGDGGTFSAGDRMAAILLRHATANGRADRYHETITRAYMSLVGAHIALTPDHVDFRAFAVAHPDLFAPDLLQRYYSPALLASERARLAMADPDRAPLPSPPSPR